MVFLVKRGFVGQTFETIPIFLRPFRMIFSHTTISFAVFRIEWVGLASNQPSKASRNSSVKIWAFPPLLGALRSIPASKIFFTFEIVLDEAPVILVISE